MKSCQVNNVYRYVDYANITKVIEKGKVIYVDDGVLAFDVLNIKDDKTVEVHVAHSSWVMHVD